MKVIFHVDVNSAFLSWSAAEYLQNGGTLDYRTVPAAVAKHGENGGGIILAKSILAKKAGVSTGEVVWSAKQKCPDLILVPPDYQLYLRASHAMKDLLREYSPAVESFSIDECFIDMTGQEKFFGEPKKAAYDLKERIKNELGFTVNVGIGATKATAKMASEFEKPDRVHTLWPEELADKLWPMPIDFLFMAGRRTVASLRKIGVETVGDMAHLSPDLLKDRLGKNGVVLWQYANGLDDSPVCPDAELPPPKSVSKSVTLSHPLESKGECADILLYIAEELSYKLMDKGMNASVLTVAWKDPDYHYFSKQQHYSDALFHYGDIFQKAMEIFEQIYSGGKVRYIGLGLSDLSSERPVCGALFGRDTLKDERLSETVFQLKKKYGKQVITTARTMGSGAEHLFRDFDEDDFDDEMPRFY
ncbi:MAG: DNA polymerase IV [Firmicutes bacterium]|nr:DNA polymerase IV [Bacillota bacterium]